MTHDEFLFLVMVLLSVAAHVWSDYTLSRSSSMGFFLGITASISLAVSATVYWVMMATIAPVAGIWLALSALALVGLIMGGGSAIGQP